MGHTDHRLDPAKAAGTQGPQKLCPVGPRLRGADAKADGSNAAFGVGGNSDYGSHRHDPTALAHLQIGGVGPGLCEPWSREAGSPCGSWLKLPNST